MRTHMRTRRFKGNSVVNRLIPHLGGKPPLVLHRLDMDTSGLLLMAKRAEVVPGVHKQFRCVGMHPRMCVCVCC